MYRRVHPKQNFNSSSTQRIATSPEDLKLGGLGFFCLFFVHTPQMLERRVVYITDSYMHYTTILSHTMGHCSTATARE